MFKLRTKEQKEKLINETTREVMDRLKELDKPTLKISVRDKGSTVVGINIFNAGFTSLVCIGNEATKKINHKIGTTAMTSMYVQFGKYSLTDH